jgi:HK97 gp10 family phage protein
MSVEINYYGKLFNSPDITPGIARAANIAKTYGLALVKARTPVDTARLHEGWKATLEGGGIRWSNDTPYAAYVEFGTRKMAPRGMLTRSLDDIKEVFIEELGKEIGKELGEQIVSDYKTPGYGNAGVGSNPTKYPEVGNKLQPKIKTGLSKRDKKTSKNFLFSNPAKILSERQEKGINRARPFPESPGSPTREARAAKILRRKGK